MHSQPNPRHSADGRFALLREHAFVDGAWIGARDGRTIAVIDPASGSLIGHIPALSAVEAADAVAAAVRAQAPWARRTAADRATIILRWADLMRERREELATLMTLEQGKPLAEARGEIDYARSFLIWFAEEGQRQYGDVIPTHIPGRRLMTSWVPVGVTAAITPWNFPSAMITRKAGPR